MVYKITKENGKTVDIWFVGLISLGVLGLIGWGCYEWITSNWIKAKFKAERENKK